MARFFGKVGYGHTVKKTGGVHELVITEQQYQGDVITSDRELVSDEKVISDFRVGNSISIVADAYANDHFVAIQYVEWMGGLWVVSDVIVRAPRLILRLGGVYNGPTPEAA